MNKEIIIESYEAPRVEIVEVEVEKGFAASLPDYTDRPLN